MIYLSLKNLIQVLQYYVYEFIKSKKSKNDTPNTRDKYDIGVLYVSNKNFNECTPIDLLLIEDKHYALITNFNSFAVSQYRQNTNHHTGAGKNLNACRNCLTVKTSLDSYVDHIRLCIKREPMVPKMPKKNYLKFNKFHHKIRVPFTIYADFESYNKKLHKEFDISNYRNTPYQFKTNH